MTKFRATVEKMLDAVELFINWAVTWTLIFIFAFIPSVILSPLIEIAGRNFPWFVAGIFILVLCVGVLLALIDLVLRAKNREGIFKIISRAWKLASTSRAVIAMSPIARLWQAAIVALEELLLKILSLGFKVIFGLVLAIICGIFIHILFGLFGSAPWWAIVIIFLLLIR